MSGNSKKPIPITGLIIPVLLTAACAPVGIPIATTMPSSAPTQILTPTPTPVPMAILVNGEGITVTEFQAELEHYRQAQEALGNPFNEQMASQIVLSDLVDTLLLAQGAREAGFIMTEEALQERIDALSSQVGGLEGLSAWEAAHGYTDVEFRSALQRQAAAALMRDQIILSVPSATEQVHVRQIILYNMETAQQALGFLQNGWIFIDLAAQYDPITKGELGWFPRGYLPSTAIEDAAFALQTGQTSNIIKDETGYHILNLIERESNRILSPDALLTLQEKAIKSWLNARRETGSIIYQP